MPYIGSLPIYFDFEYDSEVYGIKKGVVYTNALRTEIHKAFCDRVRAAGYTAGIYTNVDYITSRLNFTELRGYSLWLASWPLGAGKAITHGDINAANVNTKWGKPAIWQIGLGAVNGIKGNVDLNYGYVQLQALKNTAPPINSPQANTNPVYKTGDKVGVVNTTVSGGVKRGKVYGGGTFVVYHKAYDVISAAGKCVVIGGGKAVTAAVNADDLRKI